MSSDLMPDKFDRLMGMLHGLPDSLMTKPATVRITQPLGVGGSETYIVTTHRQQTRGEDGRVIESKDTVFLEAIDQNGSLRLVLPPQVVDTIARQRDAIGGRVRRAGAKRAVATRKERGIEPGFLKKRRQK